MKITIKEKKVDRQSGMKLREVMYGHYKKLTDKDLNNLIDGMTSQAQIKIMNDIMINKKNAIIYKNMTDKELIKTIKKSNFIIELVEDCSEWSVKVTKEIKGHFISMLNIYVYSSYNMNDVIIYKKQYFTRDLKYMSYKIDDKLSAWHRITKINDVDAFK